MFNDNFLGYTNVRYCYVYLVPILCHVLILGDFIKFFDFLSVKLLSMGERNIIFQQNSVVRSTTGDLLRMRCEGKLDFG